MTRSDRTSILKKYGFEVRYLALSGGMKARYFISGPIVMNKPSGPLVVYIQGSGCHAHFHRVRGSIRGGNGSLLQQAVDGRCTLLLVDKPGVKYRDRRRGNGSGLKCPEVYDQQFDLLSWQQMISDCIADARSNLSLDPDKTLLIGHSEGGIVASAIAARNAFISHVALIGSNGVNQLHDLLEWPSHQGEKGFSVIEKGVAEIAKGGVDPGGKVWGHTGKRWRTFLGTSALRELQNTECRIYVLHGTKDTAVFVKSIDLMYLQLLLDGRDITYRRISGADHSLRTNKYQSRKRTFIRYGSEILNWFLNDPV